MNRLRHWLAARQFRLILWLTRIELRARRRLADLREKSAVLRYQQRRRKSRADARKE